MVITSPELHDGVITGIDLIEPDTLVIRCSTSEGVQVEISGARLIDCLLRNFRKQNVIFEVRLSRSGEDGDSAFQRLYGGRAEGIAKGVRALEAGGTLLEIDSSTDADLVGLFAGPVSIAQR